MLADLPSLLGLAALSASLVVLVLWRRIATAPVAPDDLGDLFDDPE